MSKVIISDTSCLIALDRIHKLDILQQLFSNVVTTPEVANEFGGSLPVWIEIVSVTNQYKKRELELIVDKGEASAIALATEIPHAILIIDEKLGRRIATEMKLSIIGTLRVILMAKHRGIINSVKQVVELLESSNFRFSAEIVKAILHEAGEDL